MPARVPLPVAPTPPAPAPRRRRWRAFALLGLAILAAAAVGGYWWRLQQGGLPPGIASGNGRIEADKIDIDTKFAGRIAEMFVDEGDMVKAGQVLARMDTQDLAAELKRSEAQIRRLKHSLEEAHANVDLTKTQLTLAQQEFDRTSTLVKQGFATYGSWTTPATLDGAIALLKAAKIASARPSGRWTPQRMTPSIIGLTLLQFAHRPARRPHPLSNRQYGRGASRRRPGVHDARYFISLSLLQID